MTAPSSSRVLVTVDRFGILGLSDHTAALNQNLPIRGLCFVVHDPNTGRTCGESAVYRAEVVSHPGGLMPVPTNLCPAHTAELRLLGVITQARTEP